MASSESILVGAFNDRNPELPDMPVRRAEVQNTTVAPAGDLSPEQPTGVIGGIRTFPYADLIREHLAHGRVLAARNLLEFARDLLPTESKLVTALSPPKFKKIDRRDVDRSAEFRWLQANSPKFRGQWVALAGDSLVASATTLAQLLSNLKASPPPSKPLIHHLD